MIDALNLTKTFCKKEVLKDLNCKIEDGCIYGLVGANGAGKSTFLRLLCGIYFPQGGSVKIDEMEVFDNKEIKKNILLLADDLYFPAGATVKDVAQMFAAFYDDFDYNAFEKRCEILKFGQKDKISTFSKGMKRQVAMISALSCKVKYMFFDETFDGLDPVIRNLVKKFIYERVAEGDTTVILTSHNLRELEDICDHLGVLYKGGILFEGDLNSLKTSVFKAQVCFEGDFGKEILEPLEVLSFNKVGSVATVVIKGEREETEKVIKSKNPLIMDVVPLTLEEIFIYEMEVLGYVFSEINI